MQLVNPAPTEGAAFWLTKVGAASAGTFVEPKLGCGFLRRYLLTYKGRYLGRQLCMLYVPQKLGSTWLRPGVRNDAVFPRHQRAGSGGTKPVCSWEGLIG